MTDSTDPKPTEFDEAEARREAARAMGRSRSGRKGEAARANGQRGGRPPGSTNSPAAREKMKAAQERRRAQEKEKVTEQKPSRTSGNTE